MALGGNEKAGTQLNSDLCEKVKLHSVHDSSMNNHWLTESQEILG